MNVVEQMAFPFSSLDFPGRTTVGLAEMAQRLGCSVDHLLNEAEHGALCGLDLKGVNATRRSIRVPIESYRAYVLTRMTGPFRRDFIRDLPAHIKRELRREMIGAADKTELREMMAEIKEALSA
jgi:hypothetical protein